MGDEKDNDGILLTGGRDCKIRCWDIESRSSEESCVLTKHDGWVFKIVNIDNESIASAGCDEDIIITRLPKISRKEVEYSGERESDKESDAKSDEKGGGEEEEGESEEEEAFENENTILTLEGHQDCVRSLCSFPWHQTLVSGGDDKTIKIWNLKKQKCSKTIKNMHRDTIKDICQVDNNFFVSGSDDKMILKWSLKKLRKPVRSLSLKNFVSNLLFQKETNLIFVGMSNIIGILDKDLRVQNQIIHNTPITKLFYNLEHNILISGDRRGVVSMWDLRYSSKTVFSNECHTDYVTGIEVLNEREYITTSLQRPNSLKYWEFNQRTSKKEVVVKCDGIWSTCFIGKNVRQQISEQMKKDINERVNWLIEDSDEDEDIIMTNKLKIQLFNTHMFVSKVFLLF